MSSRETSLSFFTKFIVLYIIKYSKLLVVMNINFMEMIDIVFLVGRVFFGGYFFMMGLNHFMKHEMLKGYAESKGVASASMAVYISGILLVIGGLGIILNAYVPVSLFLLILFLVPVSIKMHAFWKEEDNAIRMTEMQNFLKNTALSFPLTNKTIIYYNSVSILKLKFRVTSKVRKGGLVSHACMDG